MVANLESWGHAAFLAGVMHHGPVVQPDRSRFVRLESGLDAVLDGRDLYSFVTELVDSDAWKGVRFGQSDVSVGIQRSCQRDR